VFTERYALSPYIAQIRFVFKGLIMLRLLSKAKQYSDEIVVCLNPLQFTRIKTLWIIIKNTCLKPNYICTKSTMN
jgi:hypothetical protein